MVSLLHVLHFHPHFSPSEGRDAPHASFRFQILSRYQFHKNRTCSIRSIIKADNFRARRSFRDLLLHTPHLTNEETDSTEVAWFTQSHPACVDRVQQLCHQAGAPTLPQAAPVSVTSHFHVVSPQTPFPDLQQHLSTTDRPFPHFLPRASRTQESLSVFLRTHDTTLFNLFCTSSSSPQLFNGGVPQDSTFGPLLFFSYTHFLGEAHLPWGDPRVGSAAQTTPVSFRSIYLSVSLKSPLGQLTDV